VPHVASFRVRLEITRNVAGFSLLEVLVAMSILLAALGALARLSVMSTRANTNARTVTFASLLAVQKIEQLRGLTWGFDASGDPLSDMSTDIAAFPPRPRAGVGLTPSPAGALAQNLSGYCDFLDANGRLLGGGPAVPGSTAYVRRWSIEPLPSSPDHVIVLQVVVTPLRASAGSARARGDQARIVTLKTRTAS
jgi:prepilin-type N-terminal cleavage/methylation domain-containing protein